MSDTNADDALLKALAGATFSPNTKIILPSGKTAAGAEVQALASRDSQGIEHVPRRRWERSRIGREVDELIEEASTAEPCPVGNWCVRSDLKEVIAKWIPDGAVVGPTGRILVLGDVGRDALLVVAGGGARIDVMGSVRESARIGASGGGAHILIRGLTAAGVRICAAGGGARVELLSKSRVWADADGGGAEVLRLAE